MHSVTGHVYVGINARLHDYAIFLVRGTEYPGIIPQKGAITEGILYRDIGPETLQVLDYFESDHYDRMVVHVTTDDGISEDAYAYVINDNNRDILTREFWDYDEFLRYGIDSFMQSFVEDRRNQNKF
jgi:gamma-glutamylcyclotransferase (GGCT)/AIG2-like uncharacterized protein YtfP